MHSNLKIADFRKRLRESTKIGNPWVKGDPVVLWFAINRSAKPFYGEVDKSDFNLTTNSNFFPIPYILEGTFKSTKNYKTEIVMNIRPLWFGYLWIRVLPIGVFLVSNYSYFYRGSFFLPKEVIVAVNIICVLMLLPMIMSVKRKKEFLSNFKKIMEIK